MKPTMTFTFGKLKKKYVRPTTLFINCTCGEQLHCPDWIVEKLKTNPTNLKCVKCQRVHSVEVAKLAPHKKYHNVEILHTLIDRLK